MGAAGGGAAGQAFGHTTDLGSRRPGGCRRFLSVPGDEEAFEPATDDPLLISSIQAHLDPVVGRPDHVLHEAVSNLVHVDVHLVAPTADRPWITAYTTGMSMRPMNVPPDLREHHPSYAELMLRLPPDWLGRPFDPDRARLRACAWPLRVLTFLARYPHRFSTFFGHGHLFSYDDENPIATDSRFSGVYIEDPVWTEEPIPRLAHRDGGEIRFLSAVFLHRSEVLEFAGSPRRRRKLLQAMDDARVDDLLDPDRKPLR